MPRTEKCFNLVDWQVDPALNRLSIDNQSYDLEPRVMQVLVCLYEHAEELVSKDDLLGEVWHGVSITDDAIYCSISKLRKTFRQVEEHRSPQLKTITRQGYMLCLEPAYSILQGDNELRNKSNGHFHYGRRHDDRAPISDNGTNGQSFPTLDDTKSQKKTKRLASPAELKTINLRIFVDKQKAGDYQDTVNKHKKLKVVLLILLSVLLLQSIIIVFS